MTWQYERIVPELAREYNLITYLDGQYFDNPDRATSPYIICSLFVAAPVRTAVHTLSPVFSLPSSLWYSNISGTVPNASLDAGDGQGWRTLDPQSPVQAQYATSGDKTLTLRLVYPGRTVLTYMKLQVTEPSVEERGWAAEPDESVSISATEPYLGTLGAGTMQVFYNCDGKKMLKPLIIIEGVEFLFPSTPDGDVTAEYGDFFDRLEDQSIGNQTLRDIIEPEGYDIIYVDWSATGGADYIQRNAYMIEEVIKWVNQKKAAAGSTEQNVVLGISMGGLVGKYALLDMQQKGLVHDTRLFITFDSPLRGANIPIGTQAALGYLTALNNISITVDPPGPLGSTTLSFPPIPQLAEGMAAIQAPATRQMVLYHINSINGSAEPINQDKVAFFNELDAKGQLNMRHVAISNGADNGSAIEYNTFANIPFFTLAGTFEPCFTVNIPAPPPLPLPPTPVQICPSETTFSIIVKATGDNILTSVFEGDVEIEGGGISLQQYYWNVKCITKAYDVCPGGSSILGTAPLGLAAGLIPPIPGLTTTGGLSATAPAVNHHTFIPGFSALSAPEPSNLFTASVCGAASRCSASDPLDKVIHPDSGEAEFNQNHITIDNRVAALIVDELVTQIANPYPLPAAPNVLSTYFNIGIKPQAAIKDLIISTGSGKLSINNVGNVGYNNGSAASENLFKAYTSCGNITVENGARLVVGADNGSQHGILNISSKTTVHVKTGGRLVVASSQSALVIKPEARLILEPGAIVVLEHTDAKIRIEGQLVVNGDFTFSGPGYFDFEADNPLAMGPGYNTFNLSGTGKDKRFVRLGLPVFVPAGKRLNWRQGLVEADGGYIATRDGGGIDFNRMTFQGIAQDARAVVSKLGGAHNINSCDFLDIYRSIYLEDVQSLRVENSSFMDNAYPVEGYGTDYATFVNVNFNNNYTEGVRWMQGGLMGMNNVQFHGGSASGLILSDVPFCSIRGSYFAGHQDNAIPSAPTFGQLQGSIPAIYAENGLVVIASTTIENNTTGIKSLTLPGEAATAAAILLVESTVLSNNTAGVFMEGDATLGTVLADCSTFINNRQSIAGLDIQLLLDSYFTSTWAGDTDVPNSFVRDILPQGGTTADHIRVCYALKSPVASNLMRNNWWATFDPATNSTIFDPAPAPFINLMNPACSAVATAGVITPRPVNLETFCASAGKPAGEPYGRTRPESECTTATTALGGQGATVNSKWHEAYYTLLTEPDLSIGVDLMRPVADLWQSDMSTYTDNCRHYIASARAIVDGVDVASGTGIQGRPTERGRFAANEAGKLNVFPNPTSTELNIVVPETTARLVIMNGQGQIMYVSNTPGISRQVQVQNWVSGLYFVRAEQIDGSVLTAKVSVMNQN